MILGDSALEVSGKSHAGMAGEWGENLGLCHCCVASLAPAVLPHLFAVVQRCSAVQTLPGGKARGLSRPIKL